MTITITINCDNDAFQNDHRAEVARILHELAYRVDGVNRPVLYLDAGDIESVRDGNGNRVGAIEVSE